jgi:small conductance mechanosensitive channel
MIATLTALSARVLSLTGAVPPDDTSPSESTLPPDPITADEAVDLVITRPALVIGIVIGTWVVIRVARRVIHAVVRRVAHRAINNPSTFWRVRVPRLFGETAELAEKRRRQRIDAASRMLGHLFALVAWIASMVVILHVLEVDLIPVLTSAGFIGAGLAIGGQHAVKDFISGIGILVEDRFGVGDQVVVETKAGNELIGVIEYVGAFSTRISARNSTWHFANGDLAQIRNMSQTPVTTEIEVTLPTDGQVPDGEVAADAVAAALARAAGNRTLTGMVLVDDVRAHVAEDESGEQTMKVEVRTATPLTGPQATRLERVVADELWRVHSAGIVEESTDSEGGEPD